MCLGIPGKVTEITQTDTLLRTGKVSFGGLIKEVNLAFVPEAMVNDYVIVHAGFAISRVDETHANDTFNYLREMAESAISDPGES